MISIISLLDMFFFFYKMYLIFYDVIIRFYNSISFLKNLNGSKINDNAYKVFVDVMYL